jgi:hypothetical protein
MTIQLFRDELLTALSTITGLNVYKEWPAVIVPPYTVVSISPTNPISYHVPAKGNCTYHLMVEVGVMKASTLQAAQEALDPYLEPDGVSSIYAALIAGTYTQVDVIDVPGITNYGEVVFSGSQYLGAQFSVDAWRSGL